MKVLVTDYVGQFDISKFHLFELDEFTRTYGVTPRCIHDDFYIVNRTEDRGYIVEGFENKALIFAEGQLFCAIYEGDVRKIINGIPQWPVQLIPEADCFDSIDSAIAAVSEYEKSRYGYTHVLMPTGEVLDLGVL